MAPTLTSPESGAAGDADGHGRLGFSVEQVDGATCLVLADRSLFGWLRVERLELEVPGVGLEPGAALPAPETFQRRRARVRTASLGIDAAGVQRFVAERRQRPGQIAGASDVDDLEVRLHEGYLSLAARVREPKSAADITFRIYVGVGPGGVRAQIGDARVYGFLTVPAPLLAHRITQALFGSALLGDGIVGRAASGSAAPGAGGEVAAAGSSDAALIPPGSSDPAAGGSDSGGFRVDGGNGRRTAQSRLPRISGLGQFTLDPLHTLLWHTLPLHGWRLPSTSAVELTGVRVGRAAIEIGYGPPGSTRRALKGDSVSAAELDELLDASRELRQGDDALLAGEIERALTVYRGELAASGPEKRLLVERTLAVAATRPALFVEAGELARKALERRPGFAAAHAALASVAVAQGHIRGAASHYQRLVELAGDDIIAVRAALAGARFLRTNHPETATQLYEQVLDRSPDHLEASSALAERYAAEERWGELVQLLRTGLAREGDTARRAREHIRLASVLRTHLDDLSGAREEIGRACELAPGDVAALEAKVEMALAAGDQKEAVDTLDHMARILAEASDPKTQARVLVRTAALCERAGQSEMAAERYGGALELQPDDPAALAGAAAVAARREQHVAAVEMWSRLLDLEEQSPRLTARYRLELGRSLAAMGDEQGAAEALREAGYSGAPEVAADAHSELAALYRDRGRLGDAAAELDASIVALTRAAESFFAGAGQPGGGSERAGSSGERASTAPEGESVAGADPDDGKRLLDRAAELALERADLVRDMGEDELAREEYERAHSLARDVAPTRARQAARSLLDVERRRGDRKAERRWIDALLAARPSSSERVELMLARASLRVQNIADGSEGVDSDDVRGALRDIDEVLALSPGGERRAEALSLQARLLGAFGDTQGRARSLAARAALAGTPAERTAAEVATAAAWLDAEDASRALEAARRAATELDRADQAGVVIDHRLRRQAFAILGDTAWRHREWGDVVRGYRGLVELPPPSDDEPGPGSPGGESSGAESSRAEASRADEGAESGPESGGEESTGGAGDRSERREVPGPIDGARARYRLGTALDSLGRRDRAAAELQQVLAGGQATGELRTATWRSLADVHERVGRYLEAARAYESLATDVTAKAGTDSRAEALYRASELYRKAGGHGASHNADAERCLGAVLDTVSDHMPALDALELMQRGRDDDDAVVETLHRKIAVTEGQPERQKALLARLAGIQAERLGRRDLARESYLRALTMDSDFRPSLRYLAPDELSEGNLDQAAAAYERLARELPGDADSPEQSADLVDERINAAAALADIAIQADVRSDLGRRLAARARSTIAALVDVAPGHKTLVSKRRALEDAERGRITETADSSDGAAGAPIDELEQLRHQAEEARKRNDLAAAAAILDQALVAHGSDPGLLRERADVAIELGEHQAAAGWIEELIAARPARSGSASRRERSRRAELYLELADLYYDRLGDRARARQAMRDAAAAHGAGSRRDAVLRMLASEASAAGAGQEAAEAYERIDPERRTAADFLSLAGCYERLSEHRAAVGALQAAKSRGLLGDEGGRVLVRLERELAAKRAWAAELENNAAGERAEGRLHEALAIYEEVLGDEDGTRRVRTRLADIMAGVPDSEGGGSERTERGTRPMAQLVSGGRSRHGTKLGPPTPGAPLRPTGRNARASTAGESKGEESRDGEPKDGEAGSGRWGQKGRGRGTRRALSGTTLGLGLVGAGGSQAERKETRNAPVRRKTQLRSPSVTRPSPSVPSSDSAPDSASDSALGPTSGAAGEHSAVSAAGSDSSSGGPGGASSVPTPVAVITTRPIAIPDALRIAMELEGQDEVDAAVGHYEAAARSNSNDPRPLHALARIFEERGDVEAYSEVIGRLIPLTSDAAGRAQLWYRRAMLHRDVLHSESETYRSLKAAYECDPADRDIAYALRSVAMARGEWSLAASLLEREIAQAQNDREAGALHLELAMICDEKLLEPERALSHYEGALTLDPEIPAAPEPLARLYEMAGRFADAARTHERAAEHLPAGGGRSRLLLRAGSAAERAGDREEARRLYQRAVVAAVDEAATRSQAQSALAGLSNDSKTEQLEIQLRDSADEGEQVALLRQLLAQSKKRSDDVASARYARALLSLDPADLSAYVLLKSQAEEVCDWKTLAALQYSRAGALSDPGERSSAYYDLGRIRQEQLDDERGAMTAFDSALVADPEHMAALEALANLAYQRHDWERAHALHLRLRPESCSLSADNIAYRRGVIAEALGRQRDAIRAYSEAVELVPSNREALQAKARAALRMGDLTTAMDASRAFLELIAPGDVASLNQARLDHAALCAQAGKPEQAIDYNELVLSDDPRSEAALRALIALYSATRRYADVADALRRLIALTGALDRRAELLYQLGELHRDQIEDPERAADAYLKAIDLNPRNVPTLRRLIDYYWSEDEPAELLDMVHGLIEQAALLHQRTGVDTLIRAALASAIRGEIDLVRSILEWLTPFHIQEHLVAVLVEATRRSAHNTSVPALAGGVRAICEELPTLSAEAIAAQLELADGGEIRLPLIAALRAPV